MDHRMNRSSPPISGGKGAKPNVIGHHGNLSRPNSRASSKASSRPSSRGSPFGQAPSLLHSALHPSPPTGHFNQLAPPLPSQAHRISPLHRISPQPLFPYQPALPMFQGPGLVNIPVLPQPTMSPEIIASIAPSLQSSINPLSMMHPPHTLSDMYAIRQHLADMEKTQYLQQEDGQGMLRSIPLDPSLRSLLTEEAFRRSNVPRNDDQFQEPRPPPPQKGHLSGKPASQVHHDRNATLNNIHKRQHTSEGHANALKMERSFTMEANAIFPHTRNSELEEKRNLLSQFVESHYSNNGDGSQAMYNVSDLQKSAPTSVGGLLRSSPVPGGHIRSSPVPGGHIRSSPLPGGHIRSSPVPGGHIRSSPVPEGHIRSSPLPGGHISSSPVPGGHIRSSPVTEGHIRSSPVPGGHLRSSSVSGGHIRSSPQTIAGVNQRSSPITVYNPPRTSPQNSTVHSRSAPSTQNGNIKISPQQADRAHSIFTQPRNGDPLPEESQILSKEKMRMLNDIYRTIQKSGESNFHDHKAIGRSSIELNNKAIHEQTLRKQYQSEHRYNFSQPALNNTQLVQNTNSEHVKPTQEQDSSDNVFFNRLSSSLSENEGYTTVVNNKIIGQNDSWHNNTQNRTNGNKQESHLSRTSIKGDANRFEFPFPKNPPIAGKPDMLVKSTKQEFKQELSSAHGGIPKLSNSLNGCHNVLTGKPTQGPGYTSVLSSILLGDKQVSGTSVVNKPTGISAQEMPSERVELQHTGRHEGHFSAQTDNRNVAQTFSFNDNPLSRASLVNAVAGEGLNSSHKPLVHSACTINGVPEREEIERASILNMRVSTLDNFPTNSYRTTNRGQSLALHRAKAGSIFIAGKSLDLLRQNLQKYINDEIDAVIQKYIEQYFRPAMENIQGNIGMGTVNDDHMNTLCAQILEEAKKLYTVDSRSVTPDGNLSDAGSVSSKTSKTSKTTLVENKDIRASKFSLFNIKKKRRGSSDSEASVKRRVKKTKHYTTSSGRSTPSKKATADPVKKSGPKWDSARLTTDTLFVMGSKANIALGLGNMRGRLYVKHPDLFKYIGDQEDKTWLAENKKMPSTGGKAYLLLLEDVRDLAQTDEYKNNSDVSVEDMMSFCVPQWMVNKMKQQMNTQRNDTKGAKPAPGAKPEPADYENCNSRDTEERIPFSNMYNSTDTKSDIMQSSPATTDNLDPLDDLDTPVVSPFMSPAFTEQNPITMDS